MLSALPGMAVAAHRFGSAAFIDCKPPLFRGEGDRVSGGGVAANRLGLLAENGKSHFSENPLRLAALATSPIDGGG